MEEIREVNSKYDKMDISGLNSYVENLLNDDLQEPTDEPLWDEIREAIIYALDYAQGIANEVEFHKDALNSLPDFMEWENGIMTVDIEELIEKGMDDDGDYVKHISNYSDNPDVEDLVHIYFVEISNNKIDFSGNDYGYHGDVNDEDFNGDLLERLGEIYRPDTTTGVSSTSTTNESSILKFKEYYKKKLMF